MKLLLVAVLALLGSRANAGCGNASNANVLLGSGCEVIISTTGTQTNIPGVNGLSVTYGITASTSSFSGSVTAGSSVTANAFFGDGSHLTGISSYDTFQSTMALSASTVTLANTKVAKAGDTMTGLLTAPNLTLTYGVTASTAVVTYVQASSITTTMINPVLGNLGIGNVNPATKLHMSSGTLTVDGTANKVKLRGAAGVASSGSGYLDLTDAGYGALATENFFGAVAAGIIGYNATSTHRFYNGVAGAGSLDITAADVISQRKITAPDYTATYGISAATGVFTSSVNANAFFGTVHGAYITALTVDTGKLSAGSVTGAKILDATIDTAKLNIDLQNKIFGLSAGSSTGTLVNNSSWTNIPHTTGIGTTSGVCFATVTFTMPSTGPLYLMANVSQSNTVQGNTVFANVFIDGTWPSPWTSNKPMWLEDAPVATYQIPLTIIAKVESLAAGSHTACFNYRPTGGTGIIFNAANYGLSHFGVQW